MKSEFHNLCGALIFFVAAANEYSPPVPVSENLWRLVAQEDTDGDRKNTIHDRTTPFEVRGETGEAELVITNIYQLSVLLQELKSADDRHLSMVALDQLSLNKPPVDRTHRLIKDFYWDALTRQIDADHVDQVVHDPKVVSSCDFIYVPGADRLAAAYFQSLEKTADEQNRSPALKVVLLLPPENHRRVCPQSRRGARYSVACARNECRRKNRRRALRRARRTLQ
jgi:alpha,alpha-trehalase